MNSEYQPKTNLISTLKSGRVPAGLLYYYLRLKICWYQISLIQSAMLRHNVTVMKL